MLVRRNTDTVIPRQLRVLAPFSGLPVEQLIVAAGRTSSDRFNDGEIVIAPLRPSIYGVRASGLTLCARIPRADLAGLREQVECINQTSLQEVDTEPLAKQGLMFDLEADEAVDRLKLPSRPDIAFRIREVLSNRVCDNQRVADLLSTDPSAAVKILKIANGPLCRGVSTIIDLREAVARSVRTLSANS